MSDETDFVLVLGDICEKKSVLRHENVSLTLKKSEGILEVFLCKFVCLFVS